jgi:ATP synthase subunit 6
MIEIAGSPFEQFEIIRIIPLKLGSTLDLTITNSTVYLGIALGVYTIAYNINIERGLLVPTRWQAVIELIYSQIVNMVMDNIGDGRYVPLIWTIFINLSIMNLVGIVPYTFTPTAHIVIGLGMSVSILIAVTYLGIENYGSNYLAMMMPGGSPLVLAGFLVAIEFISQLAKGVSLGVRLAANITAGHLLFAILSGFTWTMLTAGGIMTVLSIFPMLIVIFITVLEMAVALIQAYVFSILTSIYINDSIHIH